MTPQSPCSPAETCKGMSKNSLPKFLLPLPGLLMIAVGALIFMVPALLVWFIALASIAMGVLLLIFAIFMIKMGDVSRHIQS
ncbi:MAG: hypothetical protein OEN23_12220 [Paracoccaceae bacterium]|nr:hypothetical protein [Paracoccaceae bacterium]